MPPLSAATCGSARRRVLSGGKCLPDLIKPTLFDRHSGDPEKAEHAVRRIVKVLVGLSNRICLANIIRQFDDPFIGELLVPHPFAAEDFYDSFTEDVSERQ